MNLNTRYLMILSAAFLAILGVGITFLPHEFLAYLEAPSDGMFVLLVQMLGAQYLGFAVLNWMNRGSRIGGIYGRAVSMANFFSFAIGAIPLAKWVAMQQFAIEVALLASIYTAFGVWFGLVVFTHPARESNLES